MTLSMPKKISKNKYLQSCHNAKINETYWIKKLKVERGLVYLESNLLSARENRKFPFSAFRSLFFLDLLGLIISTKTKKTN